MIQTFDLDGVVANTDRWFFRLLNVLRDSGTPASTEFTMMELDYYASRPLKYHPRIFMTDSDTGYILTARKPHSLEVTKKWLEQYGIELPLVMIDGDDRIDWRDYERASKIAGAMKYDAIKRLGATIHFDNNLFIVNELRANGVVAVLVDGNPLIHMDAV